MNQYPQREGEADCRDFIRTGRCKYGESCKYHHPAGGTNTPSDPNEPQFPIRADEPPCQYYLKHGTCKFGQTCKFHHPAHIMTGGTGATVYMNLGNVNLLAPICGPCDQQYPMANGLQLLPQRPGEANCIYFLRNGRCKYGATCKYHHPTDMLNSGNNTSRPSFQSNYTRDYVERSIEDGTLSDIMKQHQSRMNANMEEGPVATHVVYSSGAVVPVNQTSSFHHLSGSTIPAGYVPESVRRKEEGKRREGNHLSSSASDFIPRPFQNQGKMRRNTSPRNMMELPKKEDEDTSWLRYSQGNTTNDPQDSDGDSFTNVMSSMGRNDMNGSTFNNSLRSMGSLQLDTLSSSPNEPSLEWSSVSTSSSVHSNENSFDDDSVKRPQDFAYNDIYLRTNELNDLTYHSRKVQLPRSKTSYHSSSTSHGGKSPSFDDGLSKMTSALLTMLDSPEEYDNRNTQTKEETNSFYSDVSAPPPLMNGHKSGFDLQDPSRTWFSSFSSLDSGVMRDSMCCDNSPSRANNYH